MVILDDWQKEFLNKEGICSINKRERKSWKQEFEMIKFIKLAKIGKSIAISTPEGISIWTRTN